MAPRPWLALNPTHARQMVVSRLMTGAVALMPVRTAGPRGVSFGPGDGQAGGMTAGARRMAALNATRPAASISLPPETDGIVRRGEPWGSIIARAVAMGSRLRGNDRLRRACAA